MARFSFSTLSGELHELSVINIQPIEKQVVSDGQTLDVHGIFYTIQGEGPYTGVPAVFVRLAGCNLQCPSCDTEYTKGRQTLSISEILKQIKKTREDVGAFEQTLWDKPLVVVTGGEPFRQNLSEFLWSLSLQDFRIQIETNGSFRLQQTHSAVIVCSPKSGKVHTSVYNNVDYWKYVLSHDSVDPEDGLPILALGHSASPRVCRPPPGAVVYLQPMDAGNEAENRLNLNVAVKSCMKFGYRLQLQTHKIIGLE